jgi:hypothetical protein
MPSPPVIFCTKPSYINQPAARNGPVENAKGCHGWIIARMDNTKIIEGYGPTDGRINGGNPFNKSVYTDLAIDNPKSDYISATLYNDRDDMAKAYGKVKEVIDMFVLCLLSELKTMSVTALNAMDETNNVSAYHITMLPICTNHHIARSRSFNIENITHYLRLIMFGAYDRPIKIS